MASRQETKKEERNKGINTQNRLMRSNNRDIISLDFFSQINSCWHRMMDFLFTFVI